MRALVRLIDRGFKSLAPVDQIRAKVHLAGGHFVYSLLVSARFSLRSGFKQSAIKSGQLFKPTVSIKTIKIVPRFRLGHNKSSSISRPGNPVNGSITGRLECYFKA